MPDVREVYEMVTKEKPPEPGALERQQRRQVRAARNKKIGAFAVAAAIGLVAVVLILANRPGGGTAPATAPPTVNPKDVEAQELALDFLVAFGAFDAEQAMRYLAPDADLSDLSGNRERFPRLVALLEAMGYDQTVTSCEASTLGSDTSVVCDFDFHAIRSDELGRGPFTGSTFTFTVREGAIVRASQNWNYTQEFSPRVWEPFAEWVSSTYPKDFEVMYVAGGRNFALTDESIRLWETRSKEYVREVNRGNAE
jgi:hypothetical protein